jgi:hypothetical protein
MPRRSNGQSTRPFIVHCHEQPPHAVQHIRCPSSNAPFLPTPFLRSFVAGFRTIRPSERRWQYHQREPSNRTTGSAAPSWGLDSERDDDQRIGTHARRIREQTQRGLSAVYLRWTRSRSQDGVGRGAGPGGKVQRIRSLSINAMQRA